MEVTAKYKLDSGFGYALAFLLLAAPLARFSWDLGPQAFINAACAVLLFFLVNSGKIPSNTRFLAPFAALAAAAVISFFASGNAGASRDYLFVLFDSFIFAFAGLSLSGSDLKKVFLAPILSGFLLAVIMLTRTALYRLGVSGDQAAFTESILNLNVLAGYLLLVFPLSFTQWEDNSRAGKIITGVLFLSIAAAGSRSAFLLALAALAVYAYPRMQNRRKALALLLSAAAASAVILAFNRGSLILSLNDRLLWWRSALAMFFDNPFTGVGWGNFSDLYLAYRPAQGLNSSYAHNIFLQTAAETGLIGALGLAALLFNFFTYKGTEAREDGVRPPLALAAGAFTLYNFFDYSFFIPALMYLFFFILGAGSAGSVKTFTGNRFNKFALFAGVALFGFLPVRPLLSSIQYAKSVFSFNTKDYDLAAACAAKALSYDRLNIHAANKLAEIYFSKYVQSASQDDLDKAISSQQEAIRLFPRSARANSDIAWLYLRKGDYTRAIEAMNSAITNDRFNPRYRQALNDMEKALKAPPEKPRPRAAGRRRRK
jgi:O-antigen ligase